MILSSWWDNLTQVRGSSTIGRSRFKVKPYHLDLWVKLLERILSRFVAHGFISSLVLMLKLFAWVYFLWHASRGKKSQEKCIVNHNIHSYEGKIKCYKLLVFVIGCNISLLHVLSLSTSIILISVRAEYDITHPYLTRTKSNVI